MAAQGVYMTIVGIIIVILAAIILIIASIGIYSYVGSLAFGGECAGDIAQVKMDSFLFPLFSLFDQITGSSFSINLQAANLESACLQHNNIYALNPEHLGAELYTYATSCYALATQLPAQFLESGVFPHVFMCEEGTIISNQSISLQQVINYINKQYRNPSVKMEFIGNSSSGIAIALNQTYMIPPNATVFIGFVYYNHTFSSFQTSEQTIKVTNPRTGISTTITSTTTTKLPCLSSFSSTINFMQSNNIYQPNLTYFCPSLNFASSNCLKNFSTVPVSLLPPYNEESVEPTQYCNYTANGNSFNVVMPICGILPVFTFNGESRVLICLS